MLEGNDDWKGEHFIVAPREEGREVLSKSEQFRLIDLRRENVKTHAKRGCTVSEIVRSLNISQNVVRADLKLLGMTAAPPKRQNGEVILRRRKRVAELLDSGMTRHQIAHTLGVGYNTISGDVRALRKKQKDK